MEAHGSHCSCYGFEGQWSPSDSSYTYLLSDKCPDTRDRRESEDDYDDGINDDRIVAGVEIVRLAAASA